MDAYVYVCTDAFTHACAFSLQLRAHVSLALSLSRRQAYNGSAHGRRPYAMHIAKSLALSMHVYVDILMDPYVYASLALSLSTRQACAASVPGRRPYDTLPSIAGRPHKRPWLSAVGNACGEGEDCHSAH